MEQRAVAGYSAVGSRSGARGSARIDGGDGRNSWLDGNPWRMTMSPKARVTSKQHCSSPSWRRRFRISSGTGDFRVRFAVYRCRACAVRPLRYRPVRHSGAGRRPAGATVVVAQIDDCEALAAGGHVPVTPAGCAAMAQTLLRDDQGENCIASPDLLPMIGWLPHCKGSRQRLRASDEEGKYGVADGTGGSGGPALPIG